MEEVLREKGELLRKGRLGEDGDVEFYEDGTDVVGEGQTEQESKKDKEGVELR